MATPDQSSYDQGNMDTAQQAADRSDSKTPLTKGQIVRRVIAVGGAGALSVACGVISHVQEGGATTTPSAAPTIAGCTIKQIGADTDAHTAALTSSDQSHSKDTQQPCLYLLSNSKLDSTVQPMVKSFDQLDISTQATILAKYHVADDWLSHFNNFDHDGNIGLQNAASHQLLGEIVKDPHGNVYSSPAESKDGTKHLVDFYVTALNGGEVTILNADNSTEKGVLALIPVDPSGFAHGDYSQGFYGFVANASSIRFADTVEGSPSNPYLYSGTTLGTDKNDGLGSHSGEFMVLGFNYKGNDNGGDPDAATLYKWFTSDRKGTLPPSVGQFDQGGNLSFKDLPPVVLSPITGQIQYKN